MVWASKEKGNHFWQHSEASPEVIVLFFLLWFLVRRLKNFSLVSFEFWQKKFFRFPKELICSCWQFLLRCTNSSSKIDASFLVSLSSQNFLSLWKKTRLKMSSSLLSILWHGHFLTMLPLRLIDFKLYHLKQLNVILYFNPLMLSLATRDKGGTFLGLWDAFLSISIRVTRLLRVCVQCGIGSLENATGKLSLKLSCWCEAYRIATWVTVRPNGDLFCPISSRLQKKFNKRTKIQKPRMKRGKNQTKLGQNWINVGQKLEQNSVEFWKKTQNYQIDKINFSFEQLAEIYPVTWQEPWKQFAKVTNGSPIFFSFYNEHKRGK